VKHLSLRQARAARGWTQEELAAASGIQQSAISKLERGDVSDPQKSTADALEDALDLQRGALVFGQRVAS
jgi:transcriptional regulator with XRE-family HTH domain